MTQEDSRRAITNGPKPPIETIETQKLPTNSNHWNLMSAFFAVALLLF